MAVSLRSYPYKLISTIQAIANSHKQVTLLNSNFTETRTLGTRSKSSFLIQVSNYNVEPAAVTVYYPGSSLGLKTIIVKLIPLVWSVSISCKMTATFFRFDYLR